MCKGKALQGHAPLGSLAVRAADTVDLLLRLEGGAPKGKGKKDKGNKEPPAEPAEGGEVSVEGLQQKIVEINGDLDHEREERNYFQLERDKINTFWEISKKELEDRKAELRNKDREMEELEERHQASAHPPRRPQHTRPWHAQRPG